MGKFKRELKLFGREFRRQGRLLLFGTTPKRRPRNPNRAFMRRVHKDVKKKYRNVKRWI